MTTKPGNDPAMPTEFYDINNNTGEQEVKAQLFGFTQREQAAITLSVPDSGQEWLDEMIRKKNRRELAGKAMQGMCANMQYLESGFDCASLVNKTGTSMIAKCAVDYASALIAELAKGEE